MCKVSSENGLLGAEMLTQEASEWHKVKLSLQRRDLLTWHDHILS